jgi:hypothetical protein
VGFVCFGSVSKAHYTVFAACTKKLSSLNISVKSSAFCDNSEHIMDGKAHFHLW